MRKMTVIGKIIFVMFLGVWMVSCSQDNSDELGDTPIYQDYAVSVSPTGVVAYAHFSKNKENVLNSVKLTGSQGLQINGAEVEYGLDINDSSTYPYRCELNKNTETVRFTFIRSKSSVLVNEVNTSDIKAFSLGDITQQDGNSEIAWVGDNQEGAIMSAEMVSNGSDGTTTLTTCEVIGNAVKLGALKGMLTVKRSKTINTTQNDSPAGGKIELSYVCIKVID